VTVKATPQPSRQYGDKNRLHVDFHSPDWSAEADRVVALWAKRLGDFDEFGTQWATLMDPEGNEFDIGKGMG